MTEGAGRSTLLCSGILPRFPKEVDVLSKDLAHYFDGDISDVHMGQEMTESSFRAIDAKESLANYKVLAFVTHALAGDEQGGNAVSEPALVFTPPANCISDDPRRMACCPRVKYQSCRLMRIGFCYSLVILARETIKRALSLYLVWRELFCSPVRARC